MNGSEFHAANVSKETVSSTYLHGSLFTNVVRKAAANDVDALRNEAPPPLQQWQTSERFHSEPMPRRLQFSRRGFQPAPERHVPLRAAVPVPSRGLRGGCRGATAAGRRSGRENIEMPVQISARFVPGRIISDAE